MNFLKTKRLSLYTAYGFKMTPIPDITTAPPTGSAFLQSLRKAMSHQKTTALFLFGWNFYLNAWASRQSPWQNLPFHNVSFCQTRQQSKNTIQTSLPHRRRFPLPSHIPAPGSYPLPPYRQYPGESRVSLLQKHG